MKKKVTALIAVMCIIIAGCGKKEASNPPASELISKMREYSYESFAIKTNVTANMLIEIPELLSARLRANIDADSQIQYVANEHDSYTLYSNISIDAMVSNKDDGKEILSQKLFLEEYIEEDSENVITYMNSDTIGEGWYITEEESSDIIGSIINNDIGNDADIWDGAKVKPKTKNYNGNKCYIITNVIENADYKEEIECAVSVDDGNLVAFKVDFYGINADNVESATGYSLVDLIGAYEMPIESFHIEMLEISVLLSNINDTNVSVPDGVKVGARRISKESGWIGL